MLTMRTCTFFPCLSLFFSLFLSLFLSLSLALSLSHSLSRFLSLALPLAGSLSLYNGKGRYEWIHSAARGSAERRRVLFSYKYLYC